MRYFRTLILCLLFGCGAHAAEAKSAVVFSPQPAAAKTAPSVKEKEPVVALRFSEGDVLGTHFTIRGKRATTWSRQDAPDAMLAIWNVYKDATSREAPKFVVGGNENFPQFYLAKFRPWLSAHGKSITKLFEDAKGFGDTKQEARNRLPVYLIALELHEQLRLAVDSLPTNKQISDGPYVLRQNYLTHDGLMKKRVRVCRRDATELGDEFITWATECKNRAVRYAIWKKNLSPDGILTAKAGNSSHVIDAWANSNSQSSTRTQPTPRKPPVRKTRRPTKKTKVVDPWEKNDVISPWD